MSQKTIHIDDQTIEISNADKVLFPREVITEGDLADYYARIAGVMLPHVTGHPISMQRFPNGIEEKGFYQKEIPDYFPNWITRASVEIKEKGESQEQVVLDKAATLVYLADQACITPHIWLSRADKLDYPDRMIFDLDPPGEDFELVRFAARVLRTAIQELGLEPHVMTTGSRGMHLLVTMDRSVDFDSVRGFARDLSDWVAGKHPYKLTTEVRKGKREDRVFLDYLRNAYGQTGVAPYAVRAKPGAPVAAPLDWEEVNNSSLISHRYNISNIFRRLSQKGDPWEGIWGRSGDFKEARKRLDRMIRNE